MIVLAIAPCAIAALAVQFFVLIGSLTHGLLIEKGTSDTAAPEVD